MSSTTTSIRSGMAAAWPICLGYIPIGLSLGVLAQKGGLTPLQMALMSLLVYAGSAQFIAVAMLGSGAAPAAIVVTTLMVNLRHLLMSSALAVYFPGASRRFLALFAYGVTDESFGVNITRFRRGDWNRYSALVLNQTANVTWLISTVTGVFLGHLIPAGSLGMDFALTGMFICLLVLQLHNMAAVLTALISGTMSVLLYLWLPGTTHVIVAACGAATAGFLLRRKFKRKFQR